MALLICKSCNGTLKESDNDYICVKCRKKFEKNEIEYSSNSEFVNKTISAMQQANDDKHSYEELYFWKCKKSLTNEEANRLFQKVYSSQEETDKLEYIPISKLLIEFKNTFWDWNNAKNTFSKEGYGAFSIEGVPQIIVFKCYGMQGEKMNIIIDKMYNYNYSLYDADTSILYSDENNSKDKKGCYVATCVSGSYDCPQVWTLRRYRDNILAKTWYGRAFIHTYYAISPTLVKWFGNTSWFKKMWKGKLDKMVSNLKSKGVQDTHYTDRSW